MNFEQIDLRINYQARKNICLSFQKRQKRGSCEMDEWYMSEKENRRKCVC